MLKSDFYPLGKFMDLSKKDLPDMGCYELISGMTVVYVGKSTNLKGRVIDHFRDGKDFDSVKIYTCKNTGEMANLECDLFLNKNPEYNKTIPNCEKYKTKSGVIDVIKSTVLDSLLGEPVYKKKTGGFEVNYYKTPTILEIRDYYVNLCEKIK